MIVRTWCRASNSIATYTEYKLICCTDKLALVETNDGKIWFPRRFFIEFDGGELTIKTPKPRSGPAPIIDINTMGSLSDMVFDKSLRGQLYNAVVRYNKNTGGQVFIVTDKNGNITLAEVINERVKG